MIYVAIGAEPADRLDAFLTRNESRFRWSINKVMAYFSVIAAPRPSRNRVAKLYIFLFLDCLLVAVVMFYDTLPATNGPSTVEATT